MAERPAEIDGATRLLAMRGVTKRYGGVVALAGVDLDVAPGEVHALIGENGAGKSTLMKVLAGAVAPDGGAMELGQRPFAPVGPSQARDAGVAMIYQELNLAPHLSVEANIMLGREDRRRGLLDPGPGRRRITEVLGFLGRPDIAPTTRVADLSPAAKQLVEIARALVGEARIIVMDEPTSSLTQQDAAHLFEVIDRVVAERGVSIIYISHFLEEVQRVAQRFTVLRDGQTVGCGTVAETSLDELIRLMVGRDLGDVYPRVPHRPGTRLLACDGLRGRELPVDASFALDSGEILGVFGLVGAGRTEMFRVLMGLDPRAGGQVEPRLDRATPHARLAQGIGLLSEDRKGEGLALGLDIATNVALSALQPVQRHRLLRRRRLGAVARHWEQRLGIKAASPWQPVGGLSGGNQQKVALARLLHHDVDVLLLDEPTRGVDVGSKVEIYRLMGELVQQGKGIVMVSSYLPELLGVCHRIAVMHRGVLSPARRVEDWDEAALMAEASLGGAA